MPIPLADRYGKLNAPRAEAGKAPSTAQYEANIGKIGENTMRMMQHAGNNLAKAVTYMNRQKENMAAQDALTEYLAGRQKLDSVRDALSLENAVAFEDEYYKEAEKMHTEFVNKINRLQYADIRERARGQANDTNVMDAAKAENFFWKNKEAVADLHTNALIETKRRDVVNNVNSAPGMDEYNKGNIAEGYQFVLDTRKNRLLEKGYREGSEEMNLAMSQEKDAFFAGLIEELSHRPDDGLHLAHQMGVAFKDEMTPEEWNRSMHSISADNLSEELYKNPNRFFKNGDVMTGTINMKAAEKESAGLNDRERRSILESFQDEVRRGSTTRGAAVKTLESTKYIIDQGLWMQSTLGTFAGLIKDNNDISGISTADREKISKYLQQNVDPTTLVNKLYEWEDKTETGALTEADSKKLLELKANFITLLGSDPELGRKSLRETWFRGKKPSAADVGYATIITQHINSHRDKTWRDYIPFGLAGKSPMRNLNLGGLDDALRAARDVVSLPKYQNIQFDSMPADARNGFFGELADKINYEVGNEYAMRLGGAEGLGTAIRQKREGKVGAVLDAVDEFRLNPDPYRKRWYDPFVGGTAVAGTVRAIEAFELSSLYYVGNKYSTFYNNFTTMPKNVPLRVKSTNKIGQFKETYMSAAEPAERLYSNNPSLDRTMADTNAVMTEGSGPTMTASNTAYYKQYADKINYYRKQNKNRK